MNLLEASIRLFNAIPEEYCSKNYILYNNAIFPKSTFLNEEVSKVIYNIYPNLDNLTSSFWKNWIDIENRTHKELINEAIKHYFSTYGSNSLGIKTRK